MQEIEIQAEARMPLIGDDAPAFEAKTTKGPISFPKDYKGKWVILFSHPADFTPVCTTEFMGFAAIQDKLRAMNTELIGLSIDSIFAHIAWLRTIEEKIELGEQKGVHIDFPVIEDLTMNVAKKYGMLQPAASTTQAVRAVFVIDPKGKIRAVIYYPLSNGRNMDEIKRLIQALQFTEEHGLATPANWRPGDEAIIPPPVTADAAVDRMAGKDGGRCVDWFLCLKKP